MEKKAIKTFKEYLDIVDELTNAGHEIILFRGQGDNFPLLPSIARANPNIDTTQKEKEMLAELKRRTQLKITTLLKDDWEWLVYAQHYGMKTRLLDWSSNPLTALWFACSNEYKAKNDSYVYIFLADSSYLINSQSNESPFEQKKTRILRPALNNERIIAQAGWFTAHKYTKTNKRFVRLELNKELRNSIIEVGIPSGIKPDILKRLSIFGINSQTLFPDIMGICTHLNWMYAQN